MKENVFISGHKNPDSDSICSAYCYAHLKNQIDKEKNYKAICPGTLNHQTKFIFEKFNVQPPPFYRDIYPKVKDIMTSKVISIQEQEPIWQIMKNIHELNINLTPVQNEHEDYLGAVSIHELTHFFMQGGIAGRPLYLFRPQNLEKTLTGTMWQQGDKEEVLAHILTASMPLQKFAQVSKDLLAQKTVLVTGNRQDIVALSLKNPLAGIIFTGVQNPHDMHYDFQFFQGFVFFSSLDTAETIRRLTFSVPVKSVMNKELLAIDKNEYLDVAKKRMIESHQRELPVLDEQGKLKGILTRSDLIKKTKTQLILMDHNELGQAIDGAEHAEILEIIDHHRLGTIKTNTPIHFYAKPVGSTCSLVYELYLANNITPSKEIASILLSGILSDTVILKSPTTTEVDKKIAQELAKIAELNVEEHGLEIFSSTASLKNREPLSIIQTDFKMYEEFGKKIGVAQVEVPTLIELDEVKSALFESLEAQKNKMALAWAMLLVTDIIDENSILLMTQFEAGEKLIAYKKINPKEFYLPGVISRKKQLLPEILRVLEATSS